MSKETELYEAGLALYLDRSQKYECALQAMNALDEKIQSLQDEEDRALIYKEMSAKLLEYSILLKGINAFLDRHRPPIKTFDGTVVSRSVASRGFSKGMPIVIFRDLPDIETEPEPFEPSQYYEQTESPENMLLLGKTVTIPLAHNPSCQGRLGRVMEVRELFIRAHCLRETCSRPDVYFTNDLFPRLGMMEILEKIRYYK